MCLISHGSWTQHLTDCSPYCETKNGFCCFNLYHGSRLTIWSHFALIFERSVTKLQQLQLGNVCRSLQHDTLKQSGAAGLPASSERQTNPSFTCCFKCFRFLLFSLPQTLASVPFLPQAVTSPGTKCAKRLSERHAGWPPRSWSRSDLAGMQTCRTKETQSPHLVTITPTEYKFSVIFDKSLGWSYCL